MRQSRGLPLVLVLSGVFAGCDDDLTGPSLADLAGSYKAAEFTYTADSGDAEVNIIDAGGDFTAEVEESGAFTASLLLPGEEQAIPLAGQLVRQGEDGLVLDFDEQSNTFFDDLEGTFTLTDTQLTFAAEDVVFDFPAPLDEVDGEVPASLFVALNRL